jgi:RNA polymerase sigma-70 factor (ECF subfamily)
VLKEDICWINRIKNGKKNEYSNIVKKYKNGIYSFIFRMVRNQEDAMDLAQETFIKAYNNLDTFKVEHSFKSWLYTIASHHTIDFLRKKKHMKKVELEDRDGTESYVSPVDRLINDEKIKRLNRAVNGLKESYRMAIILKHKRGMSVKEISEIMGVPQGTVKTWLHRARAELRKKIGQVNGI